MYKSTQESWLLELYTMEISMSAYVVALSLVEWLHV